MQFEGFLFGATAVVGIVFYAVIMLCLLLSLSSRKHKVYDAATHLIRAGEALTESSSTLLRENSAEQKSFMFVRGIRPDGDDETARLTADAVDGGSPVNIPEPFSQREMQRVSRIFSKAGKTLRDAGYALIQPAPSQPSQPAYPGDEQSNETSNLELQQVEFPDGEVDDAQATDILRRYTEVTEIVTIAQSALSDAGSRLKAVSGGRSVNAQNIRSGEKKINQVGEIIEQAGNCLQTNSDEDLKKAGAMLCKAANVLSKLNRQESHSTNLCSSCSFTCNGITSKIVAKFPFLLYSLYRLVFRHSVEEVILPGPGMTTRREYLFGGYRIPKNPHLLHAYYLAMLVTVANWFFVMFFDTAFYRKTTTCNDLNVRRDAYLCFDVSQSILAGPVNCTDPTIRDDLDIYVLCYLKFFNIPVALSLAFSFAQLMILLIHISFALTLWCVKNFKPYASFALHAILFVLYVTLFFCYGVVVGVNANDVQYEGPNLFYGGRILRILMVILGGVTLFLLTLLSPYSWLIDKHYREHCPTYGYEGKKDV